MGRRTGDKVIFLCLGCGKTEVVPIGHATILKELVRYHPIPEGWAMLYPSWAYPARSGICKECLQKQGLAPVYGTIDHPF